MNIKDNNLNRHTKFRYEECYAKKILEYLFPERYSNLVIVDKPDLRDEKRHCGIEVTDCTSEREKELTSNWCKANNSTGEKKRKATKRMAQLEVEYTGGVQMWDVQIYGGDIDESPVSNFIKAVEGKIEKLNDGGYESLDEYAFIVLSNIFIPNTQLCNVLQRLIDLNNKLLSFCNIYLVTNENTVIDFNLRTKEYAEKSFDTQRRNIAESAYRMSEGFDD